MERNPSRSRRSAGCILMVLGLFSCSDASGPEGDTRKQEVTPIATRMQLSQKSITLVVPATSIVSGVVLDQTGAVMPAAVVTFTSRDSTTVRVDGSGLLTAVAAGESWVVAVSGALRDSISVTVRYHVAVNETKARLRGADGQDVVRTLHPRAQLADVVGGTAEDWSTLLMDDEPEGNVAIAVQVAGAFTVGSLAIGPLDVDALLRSGEVPNTESVAYVLVVSGADALLYASLPGSRFEVEGLTPSTGAGSTGMVSGRIVLRASGYRLSGGDDGFDTATPTGDTLTAYVDFASTFEQINVGKVTVTASGGPLPAGPTTIYAWYYPPRYGDVGYLGAEGDFNVRLYMSQPVVGTTSLHTAWLGISPDAERAPYLQLVSYKLSTMGYSQWGTLTLDEVRPPDGETWGEIRGRAKAVVAYWDVYGWSDPYSTMGGVDIEFDAPMVPESWFANRAPTAEGSGFLWWRPLHRGVPTPRSPARGREGGR